MLKAHLLKLMVENRVAYISGGELAKELGVSRNAVWKAVQSLRAEGYDIAAITNKGYRLENSGDILSEAGMYAFVETAGAFRFDVRKTVTSTNTVLRDLAAAGAPEGYVLVAEEQTAGKGRRGRGFHSPAGNGVYFSLLLRPGARTGDSQLITSAAAVAVARAIEAVFGVKPGIKWVNDIFVEGKKVCGILTEAAFGMESGLIESAVLGIGINVTKPERGFPKEIESIAGVLTGGSKCADNERCRLIAASLDNFWAYYQNLAAHEFLEEYRERSIIIGKEIDVVTGLETQPAQAIAIDDNCALVVRYKNGETATLNSGEVSVRV